MTIFNLGPIDRPPATPLPAVLVDGGACDTVDGMGRMPFVLRGGCAMLMREDAVAMVDSHKLESGPIRRVACKSFDVI
jgi:hypothetical protein